MICEFCSHGWVNYLEIVQITWYIFLCFLKPKYNYRGNFCFHVWPACFTCCASVMLCFHAVVHSKMSLSTVTYGQCSWYTVRTVHTERMRMQTQHEDIIHLTFVVFLSKLNIFNCKNSWELIWYYGMSLTLGVAFASCEGVLASKFRYITLCCSHSIVTVSRSPRIGWSSDR